MLQALRTNKIAVFCCTALLFFLILYPNRPPELADDGAFFLRYAEHMADGFLWRWNSEEDPIWGASAPFYPVLVALGILVGLAPLTSVQFLSAACTALTLSLMTIGRRTDTKIIPSLIFSSLFLLNANIQAWSFSGLETPLTLLLCALCFSSLHGNSRPVWEILLGTSLMLHKLDCIPIGILFLICSAIKKHRQTLSPWKKILICLGLLCLWHGFAWFYFGSPLPNSFQTKFLYQQSFIQTIDQSWFSSLLFLQHSHRWLSLFAIFPFILYRSLSKQEQPSILFAYGIIAIHTLGYSIYHPFEPYDWYAMPSLFCLVFLSSSGITTLSLQFPALRYRSVIALICLGFLLRISYPLEKQHAENWERYLYLFEADRANAGRWVAQNTPKDFVLLTGWGNPALYAQRRTIDSSFLQRRFEDVDLVLKYKPDVIIFQGKPTSSPAEPLFSILNRSTYKHYETVQTFTRAYQEGEDYFFGVLVRKDRLEEIQK